MYQYLDISYDGCDKTFQWLIIIFCNVPTVMEQWFYIVTLAFDLLFKSFIKGMAINGMVTLGAFVFHKLRHVYFWSEEMILHIFTLTTRNHQNMLNLI
jgi:hypothetical protein